MKSLFSKATLCSSLLGMMLVAGSLPALSDPGASMGSGIINLKCDEKISGTFQGFHYGQILMKTDAGENVELPSMALFFYTDPQVHQSELQVGQHLTVCLPDRTVMRVIYGGGPVLTLGTYDGVSKIPQTVVSSWNTDTSVWTAER